MTASECNGQAGICQLGCATYQLSSVEALGWLVLPSPPALPTPPSRGLRPRHPGQPSPPASGAAGPGRAGRRHQAVGMSSPPRPPRLRCVSSRCSACVLPGSGCMRLWPRCCTATPSGLLRYCGRLPPARGVLQQGADAITHTRRSWCSPLDAVPLVRGNDDRCFQPLSPTLFDRSTREERAGLEWCGQGVVGSTCHGTSRRGVAQALTMHRGRQRTTGKYIQGTTYRRGEAPLGSVRVSGALGT